MSLFKAGQLDAAGSPLVDVATGRNSSFGRFQEAVGGSVGSNALVSVQYKKGPFTSQKLRKALTLALDRKGLVDNVTQGNQYPALTVVPLFWIYSHSNSTYETTM